MAAAVAVTHTPVVVEQQAIGGGGNGDNSDVHFKQQSTGDRITFSKTFGPKPVISDAKSSFFGLTPARLVSDRSESNERDPLIEANATSAIKPVEYRTLSLIHI